MSVTTTMVCAMLMMRTMMTLTLMVNVCVCRWLWCEWWWISLQAELQKDNKKHQWAVRKVQYNAHSFCSCAFSLGSGLCRCILEQCGLLPLLDYWIFAGRGPLPPLMLLGHSRSFCAFSAVSLSLLWVLLETVHLALAQIFKSQDSMHMQWLDATCILTYRNNMTCIYTFTYVIFIFCVWCTCLAKIASRRSRNNWRVDSVACKERHLSKVEPGRQLAAGAAFRI